MLGHAAIAFGGIVGRLAIIIHGHFVAGNILGVGRLVAFHLRVEGRLNLLVCRLGILDHVLIHPVIGQAVLAVLQVRVQRVALLRQRSNRFVTGGRFVSVGGILRQRDVGGNIVLDSRIKLGLRILRQLRLFLGGELIEAQLVRLLIEQGLLHAALNGHGLDLRGQAAVGDVVALRIEVVHDLVGVGVHIGLHDVLAVDRGQHSVFGLLLLVGRNRLGLYLRILGGGSHRWFRQRRTQPAWTASVTIATKRVNFFIAWYPFFFARGKAHGSIDLLWHDSAEGARLAARSGERPQPVHNLSASKRAPHPADSSRNAGTLLFYFRRLLFSK